MHGHSTSCVKKSSRSGQYFLSCARKPTDRSKCIKLGYDFERFFCFLILMLSLLYYYQTYWPYEVSENLHIYIDSTLSIFRCYEFA